MAEARKILMNGPNDQNRLGGCGDSPHGLALLLVRKRTYTLLIEN